MLELEKDFDKFRFADVPEEKHKERLFKLVELAEKADGKELNEMMADLWRLADAIESAGNKGWKLKDIELFSTTLKDYTYLIRKDYALVREGILYHAEGTRKRDFKGWYVRKNPHWKLKWAEKMGWQHPKSQIVLAEQHAKAIAEDAFWMAKRARPVGVIKHRELDILTATQVAHRYAIAYIMSRQPNTAHPLDKWESNVWYAQYESLASELVWRALYGTPEQQKDASKFVNLDKAHKFMQDTPLLYAAELCKDAILNFYSNDFIYSAMRRPMPVFWDEMIESDLPIPVSLREAERMSDEQIILKFWGIISGTDYESTKIPAATQTLILNMLRKLCKNNQGDWE